MAIPSVNMLSNLVGGAIPNVMNAHNTFANSAHLRGINAIKEKYAPITTQAEAASKLAYANLMAPQFLAKLLQNPGAIANMGDPAAIEALKKVVAAGMGQGTGNAFNLMPGQSSNSQSPNTFSGWLTNGIKNIFGQNQNNQMPAQAQYAPQMPQQGQPQQQAQGQQQFMPGRDDVGINKEALDAHEEWLSSPEGQAEVAKGERANMITPEQALAWKRNRDASQTQPSYAEKTGKHLGTIKQLEKAGDYRAEAVKDIGKSQLGLSHSGAVLNRMTDIVKNPLMQNMRNKIPLFQDKQLKYLQKVGTKEEQKLIGDFLSTAESFIASTVQGFSGKPLVREFDLAQRQKITPNDTMAVAEGKLRSSIALHDIAEKKNDIISDLLSQGVNESTAVKMANKLVDVSGIEKNTDRLLENRVTIRNNNTGEERTVTASEARKLGVPNV